MDHKKYYLKGGLGQGGLGTNIFFNRDYPYILFGSVLWYYQIFDLYSYPELRENSTSAKEDELLNIFDSMLALWRFIFFDIDNENQIKEYTELFHMTPAIIDLFVGNSPENEREKTILALYKKHAISSRSAVSADYVEYDELLKVRYILEACYYARIDHLLQYLSYDEYMSATDRFRRKLNKLSITETEQAELKEENRNLLSVLKLLYSNYTEENKSTCKATLLASM